MKKIMLLMVLFISTYTMAQMPFLPKDVGPVLPMPVGKPTKECLDKWYIYDSSYFYVTEISGASLEKTIKLYKKILRLNNADDNFADQSVFSSTTDSEDTFSIYIDIKAGNGQLTYLALDKNGYKYFMTSDKETNTLAILILNKL